MLLDQHDDSTHQDPATVKKDEGARYAVEVDGVVRTHRDDMAVAVDAAAVLRSSPGNKMVRVVDTLTGMTVPDRIARPSVDAPLFRSGPQNCAQLNSGRAQAKQC